MKGTKVHKLLYYKKVQELIKRHKRKGVSWKEVWAEKVYPIYPMSYRAFMMIKDEKDVDRQIAEEVEKENRK